MQLESFSVFVCRFSEATHDNEYKKSMVKTPARMSLCVTSSTPQKQATDGGKQNNVKSSTSSVTKTPGTFLPFLFLECYWNLPIDMFRAVNSFFFF